MKAEAQNLWGPRHFGLVYNYTLLGTIIKAQLTPHEIHREMGSYHTQPQHWPNPHDQKSHPLLPAATLPRLASKKSRLFETHTMTHWHHLNYSYMLIDIARKKSWLFRITNNGYVVLTSRWHYTSTWNKW